MTADEKNHVISNANDELNRQVTRLDTVFPFIAGEISDESRLGSLTHWAYSNRNTATKTTTNERPRREVAASKELAEAEAFSRSEARREAVLARKHRRGHADSEFDDTRSGSRKGHSSKARSGAATGEPAADNTVSGSTAATKRRKVERPTPAESATPMERTASGAGSTAGRAGSKDAQDPAKKRSRAPNSGTAAARKRYVSPPLASFLLTNMSQEHHWYYRSRVSYIGTITRYRNLQCAAKDKPCIYYESTTIISCATERCTIGQWTE